MSADRLAAVEAALVEARRAAVAAELEWRQREAAVRALEEELRRAKPDTSAPLTGVRMTDAILSVLRESDALLGPKAIWERMVAGGWDGDDEASVSGTLSYLLRAGSVRRPQRGQYIAVDR